MSSTTMGDALSNGTAGPRLARPGSAERLSNAVVGWFKERIGRGPTNAKTQIGDDHVLVLLSHVQTTVERTLVEADQGALVDQLHRTLRGLYREELCALVSVHLDRPVATMLSDHDPDTDCSALVFLLDRHD